jgi:hypothetical protein
MSAWEKVGNIMGPTGPEGPEGPAGTFEGSANFVCGETPIGVLDGVNKVFTASSTFLSDTLEVYLNGLRQRQTADYDELSTTQFQFVLAPLASDSISIDYIKSVPVNAVYGEVPSGALNGLNKDFSTASPYSPLLLAVYLSGLRLRRTDDYVELSSTTFQLVNAPQPTDSLSVDYFQP